MHFNVFIVFGKSQRVIFGTLIAREKVLILALLDNNVNRLTFVMKISFSLIFFITFCIESDLDKLYANDEL